MFFYCVFILILYIHFVIINADCNYISNQGYGYLVNHCYQYKGSNSNDNYNALSIQWNCKNNGLYKDFYDNNKCRDDPIIGINDGDGNTYNCNNNDIIGCDIVLFDSCSFGFDNYAFIVDECFNFKYDGDQYSRIISCTDNNINAKLYGEYYCNSDNYINSTNKLDGITDCYHVKSCDVKSNILGKTFGKYWLFVFIASVVFILCYIMIICRCCCCRKKSKSVNNNQNYIALQNTNQNMELQQIQTPNTRTVVPVYNTAPLIVNPQQLYQPPQIIPVHHPSQQSSNISSIGYSTNDAGFNPLITPNNNDNNNNGISGGLAPSAPLDDDSEQIQRLSSEGITKNDDINGIPSTNAYQFE